MKYVHKKKFYFDSVYEICKEGKYWRMMPSVRSPNENDSHDCEAEVTSILAHSRTSHHFENSRNFLIKNHQFFLLFYVNIIIIYIYIFIWGVW